MAWRDHDEWFGSWLEIVSRRGRRHGRVLLLYYYHMPTFRAFHVTIRIDSKDVSEYDVQVDDNEKQVSCWIPSEAGMVSIGYTAPFAYLPTVYSELFGYRRAPGRYVHLMGPIDSSRLWDIEGRRNHFEPIQILQPISAQAYMFYRPWQAPIDEVCLL